MLDGVLPEAQRMVPESVKKQIMDQIRQEIKNDSDYMRLMK